MKKIINISIVAVLAVMPMVVHASPVTPGAATTSSEPFAGVTLDSGDPKVASTSYVQGAYNAAIDAVNKRLISSDGTNTLIMDRVVKQTIGATGSTSDTALVSETAVRSAISNAGGQTASDVKGLIGLAANGAADGLTGDTTSGTLAVDPGNGITVDSNGVNVNYDNATIGLIASGTDQGKLEVKDGSITVSKIATADMAQATANTTYASSTDLATQGYVDEQIAGAAATTAYTSGGSYGSGTVGAALNTLNAAGYQTSSDVQTAIETALAGTGGDGYQTASDVSSAISTALANDNDAYQTASDVSSAIDTALANDNDAYQTASQVSNAIDAKGVTVYTSWTTTGGAPQTIAFSNMTSGT